MKIDMIEDLGMKWNKLFKGALPLTKKGERVILNGSDFRSKATMEVEEDLRLNGMICKRPAASPPTHFTAGELGGVTKRSGKRRQQQKPTAFCCRCFIITFSGFNMFFER
ncbi:hypothetical protein LXL04_021593 [Taraxacum kok-saghyz]